jgi:16S rRNA (cytosine1402-N4)-methyltransferase
VPSFDHNPVLVEEVLAALKPTAGGRYLDATIGGGGHASAILAASRPNGWLFGCDRDGAAIEAATERLREYAGRFELRQGNFADLSTWLEPGSIDGVVFDLGVSSPQLDQGSRGFSFQRAGPLDMRMDSNQTLTAAELVNTASEKKLLRIFWELGGERHARRLAAAVVKERVVRPFETTRQLSDLIERLTPRRGQRVHPATRVFLGIRMAVNDEIGSLRRGLAAALEILKRGGRLAVITFHSAEDRVVKEFGREHERPYTRGNGVDIPELRQPRAPLLKFVQRKATQPSVEEIERNPRSRSAQLRVMEKC